MGECWLSDGDEMNLVIKEISCLSVQIASVLRCVRAALVLNTLVGIGWACGINWSLPKDHFDGVDKFGYLSYWETVGEIDLGSGLVLPLHIHFSSKQESDSPYLGQGWMFPLFESRAFARDENLIEMLDPSGRTRLFVRDQSDRSIYHGQGKWEAIAQGNEFSAWSACGWKLAFKDGRLTSMTTSGNRKLELKYALGIVQEIWEGNEKFVGVDIDPLSRRVTSLVFNGKRLKMELSQEISAAKNIKPRLARLGGVGANGWLFSYGLNETLQPTLTIERRGQTKRTFVWEADSKRVLADGAWKYVVTPAGNRPDNVLIARTDASGKTERWHFDRSSGMEFVEGADGAQTVTAHITSGKAFGQIQEIRVTSKGGSKTTSYRASFDTAGRMTHAVFADGREMTVEPERGTVERSADGTVVEFKELTDNVRQLSKTTSEAPKFTIQFDRFGNVNKIKLDDANR